MGMWLMMSVAAAVLAVSAAVDTVAPPSATVIPTPAGRPWHTPTGPDRPRSRRGGRPVTAVSPSGENATCRPHDAAGSAASPYAGRCGQPGGESSQSCWRPYGVRSRMLLTKTSQSTPRAAVLYVRQTSARGMLDAVTHETSFATRPSSPPAGTMLVNAGLGRRPQVRQVR
ncbi:MAG: hypothetical protein QOD41_264 [Cryptosporangiaceae bacterium]|nr:hypothetical protein [Cryptosporangiaceae bacterium]